MIPLSSLIVGLPGSLHIATACTRTTKEWDIRNASSPFPTDIYRARKPAWRKSCWSPYIYLHSASPSERELGEQQGPVNLTMHSTGLVEINVRNCLVPSPTSLPHLLAPVSLIQSMMQLSLCNPPATADHSLASSHHSHTHQGLNNTTVKWILGLF